jgi:hypothetical protein
LNVLVMIFQDHIMISDKLFYKLSPITLVTFEIYAVLPMAMHCLIPAQL